MTLPVVQLHHDLVLLKTNETFMTISFKYINKCFVNVLMRGPKPEKLKELCFTGKLKGYEGGIITIMNNLIDISIPRNSSKGHNHLLIDLDKMLYRTVSELRNRIFSCSASCSNQSNQNGVIVKDNVIPFRNGVECQGPDQVVDYYDDEKHIHYTYEKPIMYRQMYGSKDIADRVDSAKIDFNPFTNLWRNGTDLQFEVWIDTSKKLMKLRDFLCNQLEWSFVKAM